MECGAGGGEAAFVFGDERFDGFPETVECVNVFHHTVRAVENGEVIAEEFLGDPTEGMQGSFICEHGADIIAVT